MIHQINDAHYLILCDWWKAHGFPAQPLEILKNGFFSLVAGEPVFFICLYKFEGTSMGCLLWPCANPDATQAERALAVPELLSHCEKVAKQIGIRALITATNNASFCNRLVEAGFKSHDQNVTHLMKEI